MMERRVEVHLDQMDRLTFAAGHVAVPANFPSAAAPPELRAACALLASSSWRNGSAESDDGDDARSGTDHRRDRGCRTHHRTCDTGIERQYGSTEHRELVDHQLLA